MSRLLAVTWNFQVLRYILADTTKDGRFRVVTCGERALETDGDPDGVYSGIQSQVKQVVSELKATKARLLLCVNRGAVDSVRFTVPPCTDAELPVIVRNMAQRQMSGITEDTTIDFLSTPYVEGEPRIVDVMAMADSDEKRVRLIVEESGCHDARILIVTHPLRIFAPPKPAGDNSATLVISKGEQTAHFLVVQNGLPVLSRTVRLAPNARAVDESQFITAEIQRTLLTAGERLLDGDFTDAIVVGTELEANALVNELSDRFPATVKRVSPEILVDGEAGDTGIGAYAPLIAALREESTETIPAIDFANPRRPPEPVNYRNRIIAAIAAAAIFVGGGWYYLHAQMSARETENALLRTELDDLKDTVRKNRSRRNLAKVMTAWENSRMSWLDELRDITQRMPSSPAVTVDQFSGSPSGSAFVVSFNGTGQSPDAIIQMENALRDAYHEPKTPGTREVKNGNESAWTFQTTMKVKRRSADQYRKRQTPIGQRSEMNSNNPETETAELPGGRQ